MEILKASFVAMRYCLLGCSRQRQSGLKTGGRVLGPGFKIFNDLLVSNYKKF